MKLTEELKDRVREYFKNISAEELYELVVSKYNFSEVTLELENESFETLDEPFYPNLDNSIDYNFPEVSSREFARAA